jgi:hypothetical protein
MAIGLDGKVGVAPVEDAPQCAALASGAPAGLIHIQRLACTQMSEQIVMGLGQRMPGAVEDRVDRTRADARTKQLFAKLRDIAPGKAPCLRPEGSLLRAGKLGGSELGGREELRELRFNSRSSFSTRASNCWMRRSIPNNTPTTTSRPAP